MSIASRFHKRPDDGQTLRFSVDGAAVTAAPGDTVAAALLAWSGAATRTTQDGAPRTPFCMMGVCFECLVEIDGLPNVQACIVRVQDGMVVRRQSGTRPLTGGGL